MPSSRNLKRAGIDARVRTVDATQFERRRITFDFDMMEYRWEQSLSPGNEQLFYWGSAAADQQGSRNYMGVKSQGGRRHDRRDARRNATATISSPPRRALDRVLLSGFYVVPLYFPPAAMGGALDANRASLTDLAVRLSAGNLVAKGPKILRPRP